MGANIRDEVARLLNKRDPSFRNRLQDLVQDLHGAARRVHLAGNESELPDEGNDRDSVIDPLASALFSFENGVEDLLRWLGAPLPPDPEWWEHAEEHYRYLGKWKGPGAFRNRLQDLAQDLHGAARRVRLAGNESELPDEGNDRNSVIDPLASALFSFENGVEDLLRWLGAPLPPDSEWLEHAEEYYRSLGKWKGPVASKPFRNAVRQFWRSGEEPGARWLVGRLRNESNLDTLHGAATLLAALPTFSHGPILDALRSDPTPDQALALLQALSWIAEDRSGLTFPFVGDGEDVEVVLAEYLQHDDPDLREAACRAMRLLPSERMVRWLKGRLRIEPDADVRQTLTEELSRHQSVKD